MLMTRGPCQVSVGTPLSGNEQLDQARNHMLKLNAAMDSQTGFDKCISAVKAMPVPKMMSEHDLVTHALDIQELSKAITAVDVRIRKLGDDDVQAEVGRANVETFSWLGLHCGEVFMNMVDVLDIDEWASHFQISCRPAVLVVLEFGTVLLALHELIPIGGCIVTDFNALESLHDFFQRWPRNIRISPPTQPG